MADRRFFTSAGPIALGSVCALADIDVPEGADPDQPFADVAALDTAGPDDVSFLDNRKYVDAFAATRAGACLVDPGLARHAPAGVLVLATDHPYRAFARIAQAFYPVTPAVPGIAPGAHVGPDAKVDAGAEIGAGAVIGAGAEIGAGTRIGPNAVVGPGVRIGRDCTVGAGSSLSHCLIGDRVAIYPGVRIGQDGFGFAIDPTGHVKVPQLGRVIIGDGTEIGANACIDRGAARDTVIGPGCMIDNLVQIGHNVEIGAGSVVVAQAGIAGSTTLGAMVVLAGQSGISGHLKIGAGARVAAHSAVMRDLEPGQEVAGAPAIPRRLFWRLQVRLMRLAEGKGG
ncbi:MAG: UDP-3-O-(3-hydroxymyristoyl)glucosamine N-acyltransferase [Inquilinaceae bacterium]